MIIRRMLLWTILASAPVALLAYLLDWTFALAMSGSALFGCLLWLSVSRKPDGRFRQGPPPIIKGM